MNPTAPFRFLALLIAVLAAGAAGLVSLAHADIHVAKPGPGAKVVLKDRGGELRKLKLRLPATCEANNGQRAETTLRSKLSGRLPAENGRFRLSGDDPNGVEVSIRGKQVGGGYKGKVRLTYLDLDFVGPSDDSVLCDTGTVRYRTG